MEDIKRHKHVITALDVGASKVTVVIALVSDHKHWQVIGVGNALSNGIKKGMVVNINSVVHNIQSALHQAKEMAGVEIHNVYVNITGSHIESLESNSVTQVREEEITRYDVDRLMQLARNVKLDADKKILHALVREYVIDGYDGVKNPIGIAGYEIEANIHLITASVSAIANIEKCARLCELRLEKFVFNSLASSFSVVSYDEKNLGVCVIDIGAGASDISVFIDGSLVYVESIPIAGNQITNDVAIMFRTTTQAAEDMKVRYGCAIATKANDYEIINVPTLMDKPARGLTRQRLAEIIEPRVVEMFEIIRRKIENSGWYPFVRSGIILTGGSSKMEGMLELVETVFEMPARLGVPKVKSEISLSDPSYATSIGLIEYAIEQKGAKFFFNEQPKDLVVEKKSSFSFGKFIKWLQGSF